MTRVIVVCKENKAVRELKPEISKRFRVEVLTATHVSEDDYPSWRPDQIDCKYEKSPWIIMRSLNEW